MVANRRRAILLVVALIVAGPPSAGAQQPVPLGDEFVVPSTLGATTSAWAPAVAAGPGGSFAVVWHGANWPGGDASDFSVQARLFAADGTPLGNQFQVNTTTLNSQAGATVGVQPDGDVIVAWTDDALVDRAYYRVFSAAGVPLTGEVEVADYPSGMTMTPSVAVNDTGEVMMAWTSTLDTGPYCASMYDVHGRRWSEALVPDASFVVNTYTTCFQHSAAVAAAADGGFVVSWLDESQDPELDSLIRRRRFSSAGLPLEGEVAVEEWPDTVYFPAPVAAAPSGPSLVTWSRREDGDTQAEVLARRYAASGEALGAAFRVNTYTTEDQSLPSVAGRPNGSFVVVWDSRDQLGSGDLDVFGQAIGAGGAFLGGEFQVNTTTTDDQSTPAVAALDDDTFVVVWLDPGSTRRLRGQVFWFGLFGDGFEDGDWSAWSAATP